MEDAYRSQFRLPYPLYEQLKAAAERSGRSLNAELVFRLAQALADSDTHQNTPRGIGESIGLDELAKKLSSPKHRAELKAILAILTDLSKEK